MTPSQAKAHALHYASHRTNGWDGYTADDAADYATDYMEGFLNGDLTHEADIKPHCDEYC